MAAFFLAIDHITLLSLLQMTMLNIQISDDLKARIEAKAAQSGFDGVQSYIQAMLEADVSEQIVEDDDLEKLLLNRLDKSGEIELTPAFVDRFKQQIADRRGNDGVAR
jgi:hypothetical protein